jgi:RsiW-degrading membrane proteinase PrsW (M82 family)
LVRRRTSALTIVTMVALGVGALLIAVLVLLSGGPVAGFVTTALAAVSFPLLIFLCFWLDRYEPEPTRYRIAALGWGAVVSVVIGGGLTALLSTVTGSPEGVTIAVWAPVAEEFGKGLFLLLILLLRRSELNGVVDGIIYGVLVGIGFAFTEDVLYYLSALSEGGVSGLTVTFFLRGVISPFAHPLFAAATGVGMGIAAVARPGPLRVAAPLVGYLVAVLLHAIWNGSSVYGGLNGFLIAYAGLMLPLLAALVVLAVWARRREGRMLSAALFDCAQMGWLSPAEVPWVATLPDRMRARTYARQVGGKPAATALAEYQQALTEMAFLHHRVLSGTARADYQPRMLAIRARAAGLRPYVVLPPPQPNLARPSLPPPPGWGPPGWGPPGGGPPGSGPPGGGPHSWGPPGTPASPLPPGPGSYGSGPPGSGAPESSQYFPIPGPPGGDETRR